MEHGHQEKFHPKTSPLVEWTPFRSGQKLYPLRRTNIKSPPQDKKRAHSSSSGESVVEIRKIRSILIDTVDVIAAKGTVIDHAKVNSNRLNREHEKKSKCDWN
ncbi:MAG: hypothetical protein OSA93_01085 [Akkermansiaceae bacterium]|jgi:hypothetical protein|nr:hypothetical protein [Akkermansiaceae bacterium]